MTNVGTHIDDIRINGESQRTYGIAEKMPMKMYFFDEVKTNGLVLEIFSCICEQNFGFFFCNFVCICCGCIYDVDVDFVDVLVDIECFIQIVQYMYNTHIYERIR